MGLSDFLYRPQKVIYSLPELTMSIQVLPGSLTVLSKRALPFHPGYPIGCSCSLLPRSWQASPALEDWPTADLCNEAVYRFAFARAHFFAVQGAQPSSPNFWTDWLYSAGYPSCTIAATYMNEQFIWLAPFSQLEPPGLTRRTRGHEGH